MLSVSTTNMWTVCIHFSSTASVTKLLSRVDKSLIICREQFFSTNKTEHWTECPAWRKIDSSGKNYKKSISWAPSTRLNRRKLVDLFLDDRNKQLEKSKFDLQLMKELDYFLVDHSKYISTLVSFKTKSL